MTKHGRSVLVGAILALLAPWMAVPVPAQEPMRIAAVVNDDVVSVYDLASRTRLALLAAGLPDTAENRRRLQPQVLRTLIDEKIQSQEAARQNITVSDAEMRDAIERIEQNNRMPPGGLEAFIRQTGVERSAVMAQVRAGVIWQKLINRRFRNTLQVGEDEVDEQLARLREAQGTTEYLLAEIFLTVDSPDQEEEVRQAAMNIGEQIARGAPFPEMARQFSRSASAATGGDVGWVSQSLLDPQIESVIAQTPNNRITLPLRSVGGYYVYLVRGRRTIAASAPEQATISLRQLLLPIEPGAGPADLEAGKQLAQTLRESVSGCEDLERVAQELRVPLPSDVQTLRIGDLAPRFRDMVRSLKAGQASEPAQVDQGLLLLMVCTREDAPSNFPSREEISEALLRQRLDLASRRLLRDLRRAAIVDVRA